MPELPEVETVRIQLLYKITDKTIKKVDILHPKTTSSNPDFAQKLTGKAFSHIDRIGKLLIFEFKNDDNLFMLAHLKMTGQFFHRDGKGILGGGHSATKQDYQNLPNRHTRTAFYFADNSALFFNDMRLFGYLKLVDKATMLKAKAKFGPEPIADNFDYQPFFEKLKNRHISIKALLLDQSIIAGLGNIYVDEALFAAKVRPDRPAFKITEDEAKLITKESGKVMRKSIKIGGTTFQHFLDTKGETGNFTQYLKVFGQQGKPCPVCDTIIKKTRVAGRGTHFCPRCQK